MCSLCYFRKLMSMKHKSWTWETDSQIPHQHHYSKTTQLGIHMNSRIPTKAELYVCKNTQTYKKQESRESEFCWSRGLKHKSKWCKSISLLTAGPKACQALYPSTKTTAIKQLNAQKLFSTTDYKTRPEIVMGLQWSRVLYIKKLLSSPTRCEIFPFTTPQTIYTQTQAYLAPPAAGG